MQPEMEPPTCVMNDNDVPEACKPAQYGQAPDRVVRGTTTGVPNHTAVKIGTKESLWDATGVETGY